MTARLADAVAAAERGAWLACLTALLEEWRDARDPELAALIERVSPRAAGPAVGGSGTQSANVAKRIATATAADVPPILEVALRQMRVTPKTYGWALALAGRVPPDPRLATALVQILEYAPRVELRYNHQGPLMSDVVTALDAIDDPRYRSYLVAASERLEQHRSSIRKRRRSLDLLRDLAASIRERPAPAPLAGVTDAAARIDAALAHRSAQQRTLAANTDDLLAAIYANPAEVGLRIVYADALQDAGDPRGEFIALQCGRADRDPPSRRERELLRTYARTWLGDIEPIVGKQGCVYRRGFLACAREILKYTTHDPLFGSPVWSTVEELDLTRNGDVAVAFLRDPRLRVLRRVWGLHGRATIAPLAATGVRLPWTTVGIEWPHDGIYDELAALLPELVELDLTRVPSSQLRAIAKHPLGQRIRRCRVAARSDGAALIDLAPPGVELELVPEYTFPGDPEGAAVRIADGRVTLVHHGQKLDFSYALRVLANVARITGATIEASPTVRRDDASWAQLAALLARHGVELATTSSGPARTS